MGLDIVLLIISFIIYTIILAFVNYNKQKIVLCVTFTIFISLYLSNLITVENIYILNSMMLGVILFEVIKKIGEKLLFIKLKIKNKNEQIEYIANNFNNSIYDIIFLQMKKIESDSENKKAEKNNSELKNKEVLNELELRIENRKNKKKGKL